MGVLLDSSPMAYRGYRAAFGTKKPSDLRLVSEKDETRRGPVERLHEVVIARTHRSTPRDAN